MDPSLPKDLLNVLIRLEDTDELRRVLYDILTPREVEAISERWEIIKRLSRGMSQRRIRDEVGVSVTTISRGNRQLKYGHGGFKLAIEMLPDDGSAPDESE